MSSAQDSAALVALLRLDRRSWPEYTELVERAGSPLAVLERELAEQAGQAILIPEDAEPMVTAAEADITAWRARGFRLITLLDADYPPNLRAVHDRPPLIFVAGQLRTGDSRSVAVIGSRRATDAGLAIAGEVSRHLVSAGYVVVSGLAAGIDTITHTSALAAGARTIAVLGTGLARSYPPENAALQRRIGDEGALVSQFWPDAAPTRQSFPMRNAVMSGLALGTVVVEASPRSGARVQARLALAHGRPVFLMRAVVEQSWAAELARRPGVHVVADPAEITSTIERLYATDALVEY
jgi:DNA processing protein